MQSADFDVAVIGAGPYGLAAAAHLRARGVATHVFGRPMSSWLERMPRGMFLKSEGFASSIADPAGEHTLARYCGASGRPYDDLGGPVSLETFSDYGLWFQRTLIPDVDETEVERIRAAADGFEISLTDGRTASARKVVVACGFPSFRHVPEELRDLPASLVSHSSDHASLAGFGGQEVVVIGAGQSALETAALLRENGAAASVVVRKAVVRWNDPPEVGPRSFRRRARAPMTGLGAGWASWVYTDLPHAFLRFPASTRVRLAREVLGPSGAWWLRDRIEGSVPVLVGHVLVAASAQGSKLRLRVGAEGAERELEADHAIAATGYRVRLEDLPFLDAASRRGLRTVGGAPALSSSFESSVPGLYFVGMAAANSFGPVMRFVCGTSFAARRLSRALAAAGKRRGFAAPSARPGAVEV
jgi:cation diffusion facilitator CzcD-associated flavoprotein CzcO